MLSEGHGVPLAVVIAGANRTDMKLLAATLDTLDTLDTLAITRPDPTPEQPQGVCLDKGYDYDTIRDQLDARGYTPHIRPVGEDTVYARSLDPTKAPRRWVVERLHSWLHRSRRLLVRWEKLQVTYQAFVHLACARLCFQQGDRYRATALVST